MAWLVVKLREDYEVCMLGGYRCRCMGWSSATSSAVSRFWSRRERSGSRKRAARAPSGSDSFCPESAYARAHHLFTIMSLPPLLGLTYTPATACLHSCQWIPHRRARLQLWNGTATRLVFDDRMPLKIIFNGCTPFLQKFPRLHTTDRYSNDTGHAGCGFSHIPSTDCCTLCAWSKGGGMVERNRCKVERRSTTECSPESIEASMRWVSVGSMWHRGKWDASEQIEHCQRLSDSSDYPV
jgi:hypothetical protein